MKCFAVLAAVTVVMLGSCKPQSQATQSIDAGALVGNFLNEKRFSVSGSLVYRGRCESYEVIDKIALRRQIHETQSPVEALRELLADDPRMRVAQEPNGIIRMAETDVPRDFLDHKFSRISLRPVIEEALFNPPYALMAILDAPEVQAYMNSNRIHQPGKPGLFRQVSILSSDSPTSPHMPDYLDNVTLAGALDRLADTFRTGFWVYEDCRDGFFGARIVSLRFEPTSVGVAWHRTMPRREH